MSEVTRSDLVSMVRERSDELLSLVSQLIRIPSENPTGSQREVVDFAKAYLADMGARPQEFDHNPVFPILVGQIGDDPEGYNMVVNGHLDVVPAGDLDQWDFDPFCGDVVAGKIRGRGTSDMKSGVACALFAMRVLKESGARIPGLVRIHLVSDEESSSKGTMWLVENGFAKGAGGCLVAEPTGRDNIEIGQRGGLKLTVVSTGASAHGSLAGIKGDNAIVKLSKVLDKFDRLNAIEGHYAPEQLHALESSRRLAAEALGLERGGDVINHVSANVGTISGGTRINMVPDRCEANVDIRLPLNVSREELMAALDGILEETGVQGVRYEYFWGAEPNATDEYDPLVQLFKKNAEEVWGSEVVPAYQWATSDARLYRKEGIPTIQFGPCNLPCIHSYNEDVDVEDVVNSCCIYVASMCDLLGIG